MQTYFRRKDSFFVKNEVSLDSLRLIPNITEIAHDEVAAASKLIGMNETLPKNPKTHSHATTFVFMVELIQHFSRLLHPPFMATIASSSPYTRRTKQKRDVLLLLCCLSSGIFISLFEGRRRGYPTLKWPF